MGKAELVGWLVGYIKSHGWARVAEKCELREDYLHKFLTTDTAWYSRQKYRHKVIRGIRRLSKDSLGGLGELQAMQAGVGIKCDICEGGEGVRVKVGKEQTGARTLCKKCGEKYAFL
jgi:hypothetical protein